MENMDTDLVDSTSSSSPLDRVLDASDEPTIVGCLVRNPISAQTWMSLYSALELDETEKANLKLQYTMESITVNELFRRMIQRWRSLRSNEATVGNFVRILRGLNNNLSADYVLAAFQVDNR